MVHWRKHTHILAPYKQMSIILLVIFFLLFRCFEPITKGVFLHYNNQSILLVMDKHLRPPRFTTDPNTTTAEIEWKHWHKTFENFLASIATQNPDKLITLTNYISPEVYVHIQDAATYDSAIATLKALYVRQKNEIYNRHVLASRRQREGESLDQYIQELTKLNKDCTFADVTVIQYCSEYTCDTCD